MYYIIEIDGRSRQTINRNGKACKYDKAKLFSTLEAAEKWVEKRLSPNIPIKYEICKASDEQLRRWL